MAYVLGYFAADGTMFENKRGGRYIEFHSTDKCLIEMTRLALKSNHRIGIRIPTLKQKDHKIAYRLQIGSKMIFSNLTALGFVQNKSNVLALPHIPKRYLGDFVRGYFDGDGCVYFKKHQAKDRKVPRYVFATRFTCGSRAFLVSLLENLKSRGVKGGLVMEKYNSGYELVFSHRDSIALFHLMYNTVPDDGLYLARKFQKYQLALRTLYGKNAGVAQR